MPDPCSPLRHLLCSRANAVRVARRLRQAGALVVVVATDDPLQPWRVIEAGDAAATFLPDDVRCA